jgi:hypothetical protein
MNREKWISSITAILYIIAALVSVYMFIINDEFAWLVFAAVIILYKLLMMDIIDLQKRIKNLEDKR